MTELKKGMTEMDELTVRNNIINTINAFLAEHPMDDEVEFAASVLCNLMLDLVEQTDEDFADELVGVVMENSRFDLD
jgi:hypothetical protein